MTKRLSFASILLFGSCLFFQPPLVLAVPLAQTATPTPAEETPAETEAATDATAPTLQDLQARIDALQAQVDELVAATDADQHGTVPAALANQVTTAIYLLDTAGLHDLDVRLNEEGVIEAGDAGTVNRVARLLSTVDWPEAIATDAISLTNVLTELATALTNDDVATAAPLATQVHEVQHGLSHAAEYWLGEVAIATEEHETAGQLNRVTTAIYLLDTAGLHDLDVRLNEEGVIEAGDAGRVARVARLLSTVDWPESMATDALTLTNVLTELATALTNDDVATAAPLATQTHEVQHGLSHAAEHWSGEMLGAGHAEGADDHGAAEADDHGGEGADDHGADENGTDSSGG